jgi:hypothetical protein
MVVLFSHGHLAIADASSSEDSYEVFPFEVGKTFIKFHFGGSIEWLRWTIFVLSSEGLVYALCPIIPKGLLLTSDVRAELEDWTRASRSSRVVGESPDAEYFDFVSLFVRAKNPQETTETANSDTCPRIQGPIALDRSPAKVKDFCIVLPCELQVPLLITVTESGEVFVYSLTSEIGPSWKTTTSQDTQRFLCPCPETILIEQLNLLASLPQKSNLEMKIKTERDWSLLPDPLIRHMIHIRGSQSCSSFLVSLNWAVALSETDVSGSSEPTSCQLLDKTPSSCIPVFLHEALGVAMTGMAVLVHPFIGHFGLFRSSSGLTAAVNLTVHQQLCKLLFQMQKNRSQQASKASTMSDNTTLDAMAAMTDKLLMKALDGLNVVPSPSSFAATASEVILATHIPTLLSTVYVCYVT